MKILASIFKDHGTASPTYEITFVVACVLAAEWLMPFLFGKWIIPGVLFVCLALIFIIRSQKAKGESLRDLGFRVDTFGGAALLLLPGMVLASVGLLAIGWYFGSLKTTSVPFDTNLILTAVGLFIWGLMQQYPLQAFINRRSQAIFGRGNLSIIFVATIFALLHLPNLWLMAATFLGGLLWSFVYQRTPNLWAIALSHAVMTSVLVMTVPYAALHGLKVGYNYYW